MVGRKLPDQWILGIVTWCKRDEKIQDILWNFSSVKQAKAQIKYVQASLPLRKKMRKQGQSKTSHGS